MDELLQIILLTLMAGAAMPIGACVGCLENIQSDWLKTGFRHSVMAFGGGALLSAVALVLVPEGAEVLNLPSTAICFAAGGMAFMFLDIVLDRIKSPAGQLVAMLSDFIPEALALGAACASGSNSVILLAVLMALQNMPEGFNAYRELRDSTRMNSAWIVFAFALMALFGPASGVVGFLWLSQYPALVAGIMLFSAGGILYLIFQDIAPQAAIRNRWGPSLAAVLGFLLGLIGQKLA